MSSSRPAQMCAVEATGLLEGDLGILGDHSDPFVRVYAGAQTFESPVVNDSLSPRWSWCVDMPPLPPGEAQTVRLEVLDHDNVSAHDVLGEATATVRLDTDSDEWLELEPKGRIRVTVRAADAASPSPPSPSPPPPPPPPPLPPPPPSDVSVSDSARAADLGDRPAEARAAPAWREDPSWGMGSPGSGLVAARQSGAPSAGAISIGTAALFFVLGALLLAVGRLWGQGKLRRRGGQLLSSSGPRADGEPSAHAVELVQAIALGTDDLEAPSRADDEPPRYSGSGQDSYASAAAKH